MTPQESCQTAESGLLKAQELLLDPRPEAFEQCLHLLSQAIEILEALAAGSSRDWDPPVHLAFRRILISARTLRHQIDHGSNLLRGWMQLRFGNGYTRGGLPEFSETREQRLFEA